MNNIKIKGWKELNRNKITQKMYLWMYRHFFKLQRKIKHS